MTHAFANPELERQFLESHRADAVRVARRTQLIGLLVWTSFAGWEINVVPSVAHTMLVIRFAVGVPVICSVLVLTLLPEKTFRLIWEPSVALDLFGLTLVLDLMQIATGAITLPYVFVALIMVCMFTHSITMLRSNYATGAMLASFVVYVFVASRVPGSTPIIVVNNAMWLLTANIFGTVSSYQIERLRRRTWIQSKQIEREHELSERLLLNMLPAPITRRLKSGEAMIADSADQVSVMFADIVGFTTLSSKMTAAEVVAMLNRVFSSFDALSSEYQVEKIKTIGDAYMVVAGLPLPRQDHAEVLARMALQMVEAVRTVPGAPEGLTIRIGIHSGPVVAGVIGTAKYSYDLWGDTVNTASRMESHGAAGRIQVSEATRSLLGAKFELSERGIIDIKGKGPMRTWWLERARASSGVSS